MVTETSGFDQVAVTCQAVESIGSIERQEHANSMAVDVPPDVVAMLLADKRSENTKRAYAHDLNEFFAPLYGRANVTAEQVGRFLALDAGAMTAAVLRYKAHLLSCNRAEATINRKLAAVVSLVRFGRRLGLTDVDLRGRVDSETVVPYRDTRGINREQARQLLKQPDRTTVKGRRDYALLLLLLENALRRSEIVSLQLEHFDASGNALSIAGKGRGTQREIITLSPVCTAAIRASLQDRDADNGLSDKTLSLFCSVSLCAKGKPLTPDGLYKIVKQTAKPLGLEICLSPHRLRHTSITMALDVSGGDIRRVQRLSRHARLETLQIYDDNRSDLQGEMTRLLSSTLSAEE